MTRALFSAFVAIGMGLAASPLAVAAGGDPDWPCVQRKVPEISSGQVWTGRFDFLGCELRPPRRPEFGPRRRTGRT